MLGRCQSLQSSSFFSPVAHVFREQVGLQRHGQTCGCSTADPLRRVNSSYFSRSYACLRVCRAGDDGSPRWEVFLYLLLPYTLHGTGIYAAPARPPWHPPPLAVSRQSVLAVPWSVWDFFRRQCLKASVTNVIVCPFIFLLRFTHLHEQQRLSFTQYI